MGVVYKNPSGIAKPKIGRGSIVFERLLSATRDRGATLRLGGGGGGTVCDLVLGVHKTHFLTNYI